MRCSSSSPSTGSTSATQRSAAPLTVLLDFQTDESDLRGIYRNQYRRSDDYTAANSRGHA
jgi:hypothetical protein